VSHVVLRACLSVVLPASLALTAGCGGGDEKKPAAAGPAATTTAAAEGKTFKAADVGVTFAYPKAFTQVDEPNDGQVLAEVAPPGGAPNSAIKARLTSSKELAFADYMPSLRRQFQAQISAPVRVSRVTRNGQELGLMEFTADLTSTGFDNQTTTTRVHSRSYFFTAGGKTWQLECVSTADHKAEIDGACEQAISSIEG
jgi:hypothetical protein